MRELSDNKYIANCVGTGGTYNLNRLMFGEIAAPQSVSGKEFTFAVHDMLDSVGFALHLTGYKYLAAVTERYLLDDDYTFDKAVKEVGSIYRTTEKRVHDNIIASISENQSFITVAQKLLRLGISPLSIKSVSDVVEILGAIFIRYFNYNLR